MINTILGSKIDQLLSFTEGGKCIPITKIVAGPCFVVQIKGKKSDGYLAIQLGLGKKRVNSVTKPILGHLKKAGMEKKPPRFLKEVGVGKKDAAYLDKLTVGMQIKLDQVFSVGDLVSVTGVSKGKGFAGVVKRHGFAGGPRTHGQSDRERAPGSIGQTTTPGRVYKGKRMAGRMGGKRTTVKNLKVVKIDADRHILTVSGLVPGGRNSLLVIKKL